MNIITPERERALAKIARHKLFVPTSVRKQCERALAAGLILGGFAEVFDRQGNLEEVAPNIVPAAARSYLLKAGVAGFAQTSSWYVAPWINATDPADNLTAANFEAQLDEFTNYTQANRPAWTQDAESGQAIANAGAMAEITAGVGGGVINGISLLSVATKGNGGGLLLMATRFGAQRTLVEDDSLFFRYTLQFNLPA